MSDFDTIFKRYHQPLVLYAHKFVANEEVSLDLVQDVFALIWEKQKLGLDEEHLKAYLFRSTRNACLNFLKHQKVMKKHQQLLVLVELEIRHFESGEKSLIEKESLAKIYEAIDSLSPLQREVIELSRFDGLKNKEIAERLNIPVRTVETRLFRALASLKEKLSEKLLHILFTICQLKD